jgi:hypothetical protein
MPFIPQAFHPEAVRIGVVAGIAALIGVLVLRRPSAAAIATAFAMGAAGAAVVGTALAEIPPGWIAVSAFTALVAGAGFCAAGRHLPGWATVILAWAPALGVWLAVPDTEAAVAVLACATVVGTGLVGTSVVATIVGNPTLRTIEAALLPWALVALPIALAASWGAEGRPAALPGALACFAMPCVLAGLATLHRPVPAVRFLVPLHLVVILAASRFAARTNDLLTGALRTVVVVVVATAAVGAASWLNERSRGREHPLR